MGRTTVERRRSTTVAAILLLGELPARAELFIGRGPRQSSLPGPTTLWLSGRLPLAIPDARASP
jgi:hypothetical protein